MSARVTTILLETGELRDHGARAGRQIRNRCSCRRCSRSPSNRRWWRLFVAVTVAARQARAGTVWSARPIIDPSEIPELTEAPLHSANSMTHCQRDAHPRARHDCRVQPVSWLRPRSAAAAAAWLAEAPPARGGHPRRVLAVFTGTGYRAWPSPGATEKRPHRWR